MSFVNMNIQVPVRISREWRPVPVDSLPEVFTGGWVGYAGYDTVRYVYPGIPLYHLSPDVYSFREIII